MSDPDDAYDTWKVQAVIEDLERVDQIIRDRDHARNNLAQYRIAAEELNKQIEALSENVKPLIRTLNSIKNSGQLGHHSQRYIGVLLHEFRQKHPDIRTE